MEERGRLCAKCTDLASFPECLTDPAASSQLRPRPRGLRAIGAPVLHDYSWTLPRKECLATALPGPSWAQPSPLISRFSKVRPPALAPRHRAEWTFSTGNDSGGLSLPPIPSQNSCSALKSQTRRGVSCPCALRTSHVMQSSKLKSEVLLMLIQIRKYKCFFYLLETYFRPVLVLLLALSECQESAFVPCTSSHIINT